MTTVYLHIGTPKTGTTALQSFLWNNREALERRGICFPDLGFRYRGVNRARNGHFLVTTSYHDENGNRILEKELADYREGLRQIGKLAKAWDVILLTDEAIYNASRRSRPQLYDSLKKDLGEMGIALKIIVYLRRQDLFTQSHWAQKVKIGSSQSFREYLDSSFLEEYPLDYYEYANRLSACLGRDALIIRPYEPAQFAGEEGIIQSDFLSIFGLMLSDGFSLDKKERNSRLDEDYLEIQQVVNRFPEMKCTFRNPKIHSVIRDPYFSRDEQEAFLDSFSESNQALAREYLGREDGVLFQEEICASRGRRLGEGELSQDIARVYGRAITELDRKNKALEKEVNELTDSLNVLKNHPFYRLIRRFGR